MTLSVSSEDHLSSLDLDEDNLTDLTDEEIFNLVEETTRANEVYFIMVIFNTTCLTNSVPGFQ